MTGAVEVSGTPPKEWRVAVGKAIAAVWHVDQTMGDFAIDEAWKDQRLAAMTPDEAAATYVAEERARLATGEASLLASGHVNALILWREAYIQEWTWLVHGECDFEDGAEWLSEMWRTRGAEDPVAVARSDFEEVFDADKREEYRRRRDAMEWKPPL